MNLRSEVSLVFSPFKCKTLEVSTGRHEIYCFKDALMASKGDTILVIPGWFIILVGTPWSKFLEAFKTLDAKAQKVTAVKLVVDVFKINEQRRYALARLIEGTITAEFTRSEVREEVLESGDKPKVIEGVEFRVSRIARHKYQISGRAILKFSGTSWEIHEEVVERSKVSTGISEGVEWRVVGEGRLSNIFNRYVERARNPSRRFYGRAVIFTDLGVVSISASSETSDVRVVVSEVGIPPEDKLLECSRFYSIIVPSVYIEENLEGRETYYAEFNVYHDGRKRTLILNAEPPRTLWFRALRRRNISTYAKRILPRGYESVKDILKRLETPEWATLYIKLEPHNEIVTKALTEFNNFINEVHERVRNLRTKPKEIDGIDGFFEAIYARIPKRKLKVVRDWLKLYEKVRGLAPKTTLYVVFYGQRVYRRRLPNFVGFRIDGDGGISVLSRRVVPVSGISFRGGEFERLYRDVMNLDNLIFYQLARVDEKLIILRDWVEDVRERLRSLGVEPSTATFKEVYEKVGELAGREDLTDNGVYLVFQFIKKLKDRAPKNIMEKVEALAKYLVGLVKTGRYPSDYERFANDGFLEPMRWVIKYTIKSRGYSIKKGVLILGDPVEVRRRVREVIQRIRGRLAALAESLEVGIPEEFRPVIGVSERLKALMKSLE